MFGQKDDNQTANDSADMQAVNDSAGQLLASEPANDGPAPVASAATAPVADSAWQHPDAPIDTTDSQIKDVISPAGGYPSSPNDRIAPGGESALPEPAIVSTPDVPVDDTPSDAGIVSNDDVSDAQLIDIKQKALSELIPLIDKLDQPPVEKFRTIMMMIQASDDQRLVEKAYESAHSIENEEDRAQALLDIVNEINYFTQSPADAGNESS